MPKRRRHKDFPDEHCTHLTVPQLQKMSVRERTKLDSDGELVGLCRQCVLDWRPVRSSFMPDRTSENSTRRAAKLTEALNGIDEPLEEETEADLRRFVDDAIRLRTSQCVDCQARGNRTLSPAVQACKDFWLRAKYDACERLGGCPNPGCPETSMASWVCLSADHVDPSTKMHKLSNYCWWSSHGGVEAMRRELDKCQWMCFCCHILEPTSAAGRQREERTLQWQRDADARHKAKQDFVNARKRRVGGCQYPGCSRKVEPGTERSFDWDHRDPAEKITHASRPDLITKSRKGGVVSLVCNDAKHAALEHIEPVLKAEMDKCDLLCHNCHGSRKPSKRGRWDACFP